MVHHKYRTKRETFFLSEVYSLLEFPFFKFHAISAFQDITWLLAYQLYFEEIYLPLCKGIDRDKSEFSLEDGGTEKNSVFRSTAEKWGLEWGPGTLYRMRDSQLLQQMSSLCISLKNPKTKILYTHTIYVELGLTYNFTSKFIYFNTFFM